MQYESTSRSDPAWKDHLIALAERVIGPGIGSKLRVGETADTSRSYRFAARTGVLEIAGSDPLAASVGLHHYLRAACGVNVSWDTAMPLGLSELPDHPEVVASARVQEIYYLNFCTFSYSTAFWAWPEWEREIDWMALHGISMPLAAVGHEAVLYDAWQEVGLPEDVVRAHLGSPAYLPFQYMGCLEGFGGPLTTEWIEEHRELGRRILQRERELGMTPVLPAFVGSVPPSLEVDSARTRAWQGFETTVLTPDDPLYRRLTRTIAETQHRVFGTDHLYAADPFIEMVPVNDDPQYPARVAAVTLGGLIDADPEATWVLQSWPFSYQAEFWTDERVNAFLDAIDDQRIRLLDLWSERRPQWRQRNGFNGKPWIWCALLNFGGRTDPVGDLGPLINQVHAAIGSDHPPIGLGLTMEGIHNNPMFFELVLDLAWNAPGDLSGWLAEAAPRRYGLGSDPRPQAAWAELAATIYAHRHGRITSGEPRGVVTARPDYRMLAEPEPIASTLWFDPARLTQGWSLLLDLAESCADDVPEELQRDLVDVTTAALLRLADQRLLAVIDAANDTGVDPALSERFLDTFLDLDEVLLTRPQSRWSTWEEAAGRWDRAGADPVALTGARRLLTVWGRTAGQTLDDYAARVWGGIVSSYYRSRWVAWCDGLPEAVAGDRDRAQSTLERRLGHLADQLITDGCDSSTTTATSATVVVRRLFDRLAPEVRSIPWQEGNTQTS